MKRLFTLLSIVITFSASAQKTLIDYWNFNESDTSLYHLPIVSTVAGARLDYFGSYVDYVTDGGDTVNSRGESGSVPGNSLRLRSTYGPFFMTLPTTGYKGIVVKYGLWRSGSGSGFETVTYTTDGVKWDSAGLQITDGAIPTTTGLGTFTVNATASPLDLITLDFSGIPAVENNPKFQIQINFNTAVAGNNRINNLSVDGDPSPLAVSLQSFNGAIVNSTAKLNWTSASEINAKQFVVEASSDKKNFASVGTVAAKNVKGLNSYEFETAAPATTTYYRLKMVDKNGAFSYSPVVVLNASVSTKKLTVFPNPAVNTITLSHAQALEGASVKILNAAGKTVSVSNLQTGATQTTVDVSKLTKGTYIVSVENNGQKVVSQFVK